MKAYNLEDMTQEQVQHYIELQVEVERLKNENNKLLKVLKSVVNDAEEDDSYPPSIAQVTLERIKLLINKYTKQ